MVAWRAMRNGFHAKLNEWKIYCWEFALSSEPQKLNFHVFVCGWQRQKIAPKSVSHVQHDYFSSFSQSNHWFAGVVVSYLTMKNNGFARFNMHFSFFGHFEEVLVLSKTWNDLFCSCVNDVSIWWQMFNFVLSLKRRFQFYSRIVKITFCKRNDFEYVKKDCRNSKLHFQMT